MECFSSLKNTPTVLSVIIPVYNVEDYVVETLNSLRGLRGLDAEIIIVDDGSTDTTLTQVKTWAEDSDLAVLILSKANEGPSVARNVALDHARGQLIAFLDGDDIALSYLYKEVVDIMQTHPVDFCAFRAASFADNSQTVFPFPDAPVWDNIMDEKEFNIVTPYQEPRLGRLEPHAAVKMWRKDFLTRHAIRFPEHLFFEDILFSTRAVLLAGKVALLNKTGYLYRTDRPGQTTGSFGKKRQDVITVTQQLFATHHPEHIPPVILANIVGMLLRLNVWCGENCAYDDKSQFVDDCLHLFSVIPDTVITTYMDHYALDKWEVRVCQAFIEKDKTALQCLAEGGFPDGIKRIAPGNAAGTAVSLTSLDEKLDYLVSQQATGWAHDRFNALNSKLDVLIGHDVVVRGRRVVRKVITLAKQKLHKD